MYLSILNSSLLSIGWRVTFISTYMVPATIFNWIKKTYWPHYVLLLAFPSSFRLFRVSVAECFWRANIENRILENGAPVGIIVLPRLEYFRLNSGSWDSSQGVPIYHQSKKLVLLRTFPSICLDFWKSARLYLYKHRRVLWERHTAVEVQCYCAGISHLALQTPALKRMALSISLSDPVFGGWLLLENCPRWCFFVSCFEIYGSRASLELGRGSHQKLSEIPIPKLCLKVISGHTLVCLSVITVHIEFEGD